jgi:predicted  nucleic acid-binding Zn-ribbon protein
MNPKIQKLTEEIDKISMKITNLQTRVSELEQQKDELEKTEIVEMVRSVSATPEELADFIKAFREKGAAPDYFKTQGVYDNEEA